MQASWKDFEQLDVRIGTVLSVEDFPEAINPSYKLLVDFGGIGTMKSSAQITKLYNRMELIGQQVVAIVNFPRKQIGSFMSECLVLGAVADNNEVVILQPERKIENGTKVS